MEVAHFYLDGNADAVEFCPHPSFHRVLAVSTYTLQEGDQPTRHGRLSLFDVDAELGILNLSSKRDTAGIFDIKWSPAASSVSPLLAQADADGCIKVYELEFGTSGETEIQGTYLKEVADKRVSSAMCLCTDWTPSATSIAAGLSDGSISILSFTDSQLRVIQEWKAHDFELWAASFDIHQPHLVYTGSDDCKFSCWDLRDDPSNMVFQNVRVHKMGVCCIAKSPTDPSMLLTGSYDEQLRIWDARSISRPLNEASICLGGGVWRAKHHPALPGLVLTACMHNGFAIVDTRGNEMEVLETYKNHDSLAYGADWQRGEGKRENSAVATCSFYDRLLRIWMPTANLLS